MKYARKCLIYGGVFPFRGVFAADIRGQLSTRRKLSTIMIATSAIRPRGRARTGRRGRSRRVDSHHGYDVPVSSDGHEFPWPAASATGVGSWPGTDPREAIAVILGELPHLPHLPELPARGPG